jgi:hypothetical protein
LGLFRTPIIKDNTISTYSSIASLTGLGNAGNSQIVDLWGWYKDGKKVLARILGQVDINTIKNAIANETIPSSSVSCTLKFFNINHAQTQANDFTVQIYPITTQWTEGRGNRVDSFTHEGVSNWLSASTSAAWTAPGGDYLVDSSSATQYFESGFENLSATLSAMVNNWVSGVSANYGFIIKMDETAESLTSTSEQWYRKSFHSRSTNDVLFQPYLEFAWDDSIQDDRKVGTFGNPMSLYFYNTPNGVYTDIDSITSSFPGTVTISSSLSAFTPLSLSASRVKKGIYKTDFTFPVSGAGATAFYDKWTITSSSSGSPVTLNFYPSSSVSSQNNITVYDVSFKVIDFDNGIIYKGNNVTKKIFVWQRTANVEPLVQSEVNSISSIAASTIPSYISTNGSWQIINDAGFVDVDWQPLSYDSDSNFITINSQNFAKNLLYTIKFKLDIQGQTLLFDKTFKIV